MPTLDPKVAKFMEAHGIEASEVWPLPGGKSHGILFRALERAAMAKGMVVEDIEIISLNQNEKTAAVKVVIRYGDIRIVTTGEAAPTNNKNQYCLAMAEKRGIARGYLKAFSAYGDIYGDVEADEFAHPDQGEKGRLLPSSQYARNEASKLMLSMRQCNSLDMLEQWGKAHREEIRAQPEKHAEAIREAYSELADELRANAA